MVARVFDELTQEDLAGAVAVGEVDPVECRDCWLAEALRWLSACDGRRVYRAPFSEPWPATNDSWKDYCKPVEFAPNGAPVLEFGAESFALLVDALASCVAAGRSASIDAMADSTVIWVALHGTVSLQSSAPGFPWPEPRPLRPPVRAPPCSYHAGAAGLELREHHAGAGVLMSPVRALLRVRLRAMSTLEQG